MKLKSGVDPHRFFCVVLSDAIAPPYVVGTSTQKNNVMGWKNLTPQQLDKAGAEIIKYLEQNIEERKFTEGVQIFANYTNSKGRANRALRIGAKGEQTSQRRKELVYYWLEKMLNNMRQHAASLPEYEAEAKATGYIKPKKAKKPADLAKGELPEAVELVRLKAVELSKLLTITRGKLNDATSDKARAELRDQVAELHELQQYVFQAVDFYRQNAQWPDNFDAGAAINEIEAQLALDLIVEPSTDSSKPEGEKDENWNNLSKAITRRNNCRTYVTRYKGKKPEKKWKAIVAAYDARIKELEAEQ